ncbi:MAG: hypothetical protein JNK38_06315, partial [Acidobacteria bacterium]|nr:hypothetical protein [Acidobacteriota bacterium]
MNTTGNVHVLSLVKALVVMIAAGIFVWLFGINRSAAQDKAPEKASAQTPQTQPKKLDPAAWGGNHIGKPIPEFAHGDECLFCHTYS